MSPEMILVVGVVAYVVGMVTLGRVLFPRTTWEKSE